MRADRGGRRPVVVSNHGGRQLDGSMATIDACPTLPIAGRARADSARRRHSKQKGTRDVLKALALGARAVLVGRPVSLGLACRWRTRRQPCPRHVSAELELAMRVPAVRRSQNHRSLVTRSLLDIEDDRLRGSRSRAPCGSITTRDAGSLENFRRGRRIPVGRAVCHARVLRRRVDVSIRGARLAFLVALAVTARVNSPWSRLYGRAYDSPDCLVFSRRSCCILPSIPEVRIIKDSVGDLTERSTVAGDVIAFSFGAFIEARASAPVAVGRHAGRHRFDRSTAPASVSWPYPRPRLDHRFPVTTLRRSRSAGAAVERHGRRLCAMISVFIPAT